MKSTITESLRQWREARTALAKSSDATEGWTDADWGAFRLLMQEYGGPFGTGKYERVRREHVLAKYMQQRPARQESGCIPYSAPYSLGLHVAALRADRDEHPELYRDLEEDDTMERYESMRARRRR